MSHCETGPEKCGRCKQEAEDLIPKSVLERCPCHFCKANRPAMGPSVANLPEPPPSFQESAENKVEYEEWDEGDPFDAGN